MRRAALLAAAFVAAGLASPARADFVRGTIKVDVRDGAGRPQEAAVRVDGPNGAVAVKRAGQVWVADGLVEGDYGVSAEGAPPQTVHVHGRSPRGVVFVVGAAKKAVSFVLGPRDRSCDDGDAVVEAVAFARGGGLAAGRVDVSKKGKYVCSAIIAGGEVTLHLGPGDYEVVARFAGGGATRERYRVRSDETPTPLKLLAR